MTVRSILGIIPVAVLVMPPLARAQEQIPDNPQRRWEYFYSQRAFPFTRIPPGARDRARRQLAATRPNLRAVPPPIGGTQWLPIGPEQIPISLGSIGRLSAIAVDPTNSIIVYIGGAQGGVWKTTNGGASWVPLTDGECSLAMGALAIDPVDPQIIFAGTGEQHFSADSYYGCGVLRSSDGGATWTQLGSTIFQSPSFGGARIARIVIDPSTAGTVSTLRVFAASDLGLYRSENGGLTWTQVLTGLITDLVIDPATPATLYAARHGNGIFKSTNSGTTWAAMNTGFATSRARINLAIAPSAPATLYASVQRGNASDLEGIWKTTNGAASWTQLTATNASCGQQCWYDQVIAVAPNDPNVVYFGGIFFYKSTNGGNSFSSMGGQIHVDQHFIAFDPGDPETLFVGNDGGIYKSVDAAGSWTSLNTNLALTQFYAGISLHPTDPSVVLGGTQDNGTLLYQGVPAWSHVLGGDGGFTAIDQSNPVTRYAEHQWTVNSNFSGPHRSDGGGFVRKVNGIDVADRALFIPPLVMDPVNPRVLYFGTFRIYRTGDRAESWTPISPDLTGGGRISAIAPAESDPNVVYVGTSDGIAQITTNGGTTWTPIVTGLPSRWITDIAVDPTDWQTAYLTVSGFQSNHVFRTTNGGANWVSAGAGLPDIPVNAVVVDPVSRGIVVIGTDLGVFLSSDSGATWTPLTQGMPNVAVFDLAYNVNTGVLIAATHGRGMFSLQLDRPLTLVVQPDSRRDSTPVGSTTPLPDSARVILSGTSAATTSWSATHGAAPWLTFTTAGGTGTGVVRWSRDPTGLSTGVYVDTITISAAGAIDSPWLLVDTLEIQGALTVAVTPGVRADTVTFPSTDVHADSAAVTLTGAGAGGTTWTATHGAAPWITLTTASGTGSGMVRWTRNATGLSGGAHVDTISVAATGAAGSPARVLDSLVVLIPAIAADPPSRADSVSVGATTPRLDSANVVIGSPGPDTTQWFASHGGGAWLTILTPTDTGPGTLRWSRNPTGLPEGIYVDTITVQSSRGAATSLVDSLLIIPPPFVLSPPARRAATTTGLLTLLGDSAAVQLRGVGSATATWTATHGAAPWISLTNAGGTGSGIVQWQRDPRALASGTYVDTIRITTSRGDAGSVIDTLAVGAPAVAASCAADDLLGSPCLDLVARRALDLDGNNDGVYNLGDLLALLARAAVRTSEVAR